MLITTNEKLKPIVEAMENILNDCMGIHGIFNIDEPGVKEVAQDAPCKRTIYESGNIKIVFCSYYEYFDVYGLTPLEFEELKGWYNWRKEAAFAERIKEDME